MLKTNSLKSAFCAGVAATSLMALSGALFAGTDITDKETKTIEASKPTSAISGDAGVNFVSAYFSRGILQENQGVIAEPYADLFCNLYEGSGFVSKVVAQMGIWASVHSHHPFVMSSTPAWYEFDWTPGIAVTFAKNFTLTTSYFEFDSPNDSFASARSLNVNLAFNDADYLGKCALHPHFTYLREIENAAGISGPNGNYFEVGITPGLPTFGPVTVTLPTTLGMGNNGFYALTTVTPVPSAPGAPAAVVSQTSSTNVGYFSVGPNIAVALPLPARFGTWTFNTSVTYYHLYGTVATVDVGRHNDWVFSGGLGLAF